MEIKSYKNYCNTHHFHYSGNKCPFCEQDRIQGMCKKFTKKHIKKELNNEVTENDLEKLRLKFNGK